MKESGYSLRQAFEKEQVLERVSIQKNILKGGIQKGRYSELVF